MSDIKKLGRLFERKYNLISEAVPSAPIIAEVKKNLLTAYKLYVDGDTAKEPVLKMLADAGEPFSKALLSIFEKLISDINHNNNSQLFLRVNNLLGMIKEMKEDKDFPVRSFIHNSIRATKESERNYRERFKSKFEMIVHRISSILEKQAKLLQETLPLGTPSDLEGGATDIQRRELSKDKLLMFMRSPAAQQYKLDNMDVMHQILFYPETKNKLTTLINAVDRGHHPTDGPEVMNVAKSIREWLDNLKKTNVPALENSPEKTPANSNLFEEDGDAWDHKMAKKYDNLTLERYIK